MLGCQDACKPAYRIPVYQFTSLPGLQQQRSKPRKENHEVFRTLLMPAGSAYVGLAQVGDKGREFKLTLVYSEGGKSCSGWDSVWDLKVAIWTGEGHGGWG